jgi:hypothetical protein
LRGQSFELIEALHVDDVSNLLSFSIGGRHCKAFRGKTSLGKAKNDETIIRL